MSKNDIVEKTLLEKLLSIPAFYVYFFALIFSMLPPVVYRTSEKALQFFNIGGGIERSYFYSVESKITIPPEILETCEGNFCMTKKVKVSLDLGAILYIKGDYFGELETILSLPRQNLFVIKHGSQQDQNTPKAKTP